MANPFYFRELPLDAPLCNREGELKDLVSHAENRANVVIHSPRRYGKTSIVKRVQDVLRKRGVFTIYVDFFGVSMVDAIASRLASRAYAAMHESERLTKKAMRFLTSWRPVIRPDPEYGVSITAEPAATGKRGLELLDETMEGLGRFIQNQKGGCHIVLDEFQEIAEIEESLQIEGIMRSHIQTHANASYFFVGSRRRLLTDIFSLRKRPFYGSAINFPFKPLPADEATSFIIDQFKRGGKKCPREIASKLVERVRGYPYYVQRIPYAIFEISGETVTEDDYTAGFKRAIEEERLVYESMLRGLALHQINLLTALSDDPTDSPFSASYMSKHALGSIGGIQGALRKLTELDYIEKRNEVYIPVDPIFSIWLRHLKG